jgi:O-antigen/teichoic acid export membrane protein
VVGINSAAIYAMTFLAGIGQLNLMGAMVRFLPTAGKSTLRLVSSAYLVGVVVTGLFCVVFLLSVDFWSPGLTFLRSTLVLAALFTLSTMAWCIFVLEDSVLTGSGKAVWVPASNLVFGISKLVLVLAFAVPFPRNGIFLSWAAAITVAVVPTNLYIFRRAIPRHARAAKADKAPAAAVQIVRYVAGDYVASLCWLGATALLPVLVLNEAGAEATAAFSLAWVIAFSLFSVNAGMGSSLIVETAGNQSQLAAYGQKVLKHTLVLLSPVVVVLVLGAPWVLRIFGQSYADQGSGALRLLALSTIPHLVNTIHASRARVQRRMNQVIGIYGATFVLVMTLSLLLVRIAGITGVGFAWLTAQTIITAALLMRQLRRRQVGSGHRLPSDREVEAYDG